MNWYKTLNTHQRINAKDCFQFLCGTKWESISRILPQRTLIDLMYDKLKTEGFEI